MLFLVVAWTLIALACMPLGKAILKLIQGHEEQFKEDRIIIYLWLGFIWLSNLLLLVSQFTPLTPIAGIVTVVVCLVIAIFTKLISLRECLSLRKIVTDPAYIFLAKIFLLVALLTAPISAQNVLWADTDGYQYPVIKWLANYGTVRGLALLHIRFGHIPTATTINALFDHGLFTAHTSLISNGFMTLLLFLHFCLKIHKLCCAQRLTLSDWFILCFTPIIYLNAVDMWIVRSANPDLAVMYLSGLLAWLLLVCYENSSDNYRSLARLGVSLGIGAVTLKLSAIPLGAGTILFYIYHHKRQIKSILFCLFLSGLILIPCFLYGWQTAGCPLFPSRIGCGDVRWGFPVQVLKDYGRFIYEFNVNFTSGQFREFPIIWLLPLSVILSGLYVAWQAQKLQQKELWWLLIANSLSLVFVISLAPALRFGIGYAMTIAGLALSLYIYHHLYIYHQVTEKSRKLSQPNSLIVIPVVLLFSLMITLRDWTGFYWLLPPVLPPADRILVKQALNFSYNFPDNALGLCGSTPLPCGVDDLSRVKLIDSDRGIGGGFIRQK